MDNPESVGSRNSYSKINDSMNSPNDRFLKKISNLETSQNSKKDGKHFWLSQQEMG
jgi:hypothetical protein